jgi:hypothetical protein
MAVVGAVCGWERTSPVIMSSPQSRNQGSHRRACQRSAVGVRAVADQAGFDGHADRGQDSAVEDKDDRGHPRKDTWQRSRPVRAA